MIAGAFAIVFATAAAYYGASGTVRLLDRQRRAGAIDLGVTACLLTLALTMLTEAIP
jgi:hypothetical protein